MLAFRLIIFAIAKKAIAKQRENGEKAAAFGTEDDARRLHGETGVKQRAEQLAMFDAENANIQADAVKRLNALHEQAVQQIHTQTDANGLDLVEAADDIALLNCNLIATPAELERLCERHTESYTLYRLCARYARERGWNDAFPLDESKPQSITGFVDTAFNGLSRACELPSGIAAMQYTQTPDEYFRMAQEFEVMSEFEHSDGGRLENIVQGEENDDERRAIYCV